MHVIVCVKQIPDPADPGALDPETKTLVRDTKLILDESDSYGVEMALQLAEAAGGGEVTVASGALRLLPFVSALRSVYTFMASVPTSAKTATPSPPR